MVKLKRILFCLLYYCFARWLPVSYAPGGYLWSKIRYLLCCQLFDHCGKNVVVETKAKFFSGRTVSIGDNSMIGENAYIAGSVIIGENVMMAPDVIIVSRNHKFSRIDIPMNQQGLGEDQPIKIGDDVWIGARVVILPGVVVGSGAVIGAGAVVSKDIPDWTVVAGNPAQVVRSRKK